MGFQLVGLDCRELKASGLRALGSGRFRGCRVVRSMVRGFLRGQKKGALRVLQAVALGQVKISGVAF